MKHDLVTPAVAEPITLADVRANQGIPADDTSKDSIITNLIIPACRKKIENYLGKSIVAQTWKMTLDGFPDEVELEKQPVDSVDLIQYYDTDGNLQNYNSANYYLDNAGESDDHWVVPAVDTTWPDLQDRINAVEITYTTTASTDEEIKICMHLLVGFYLNQPKMAESGLGDTRQTQWIMRDTIGHMREVKI